MEGQDNWKTKMEIGSEILGLFCGLINFGCIFDCHYEEPPNFRSYSTSILQVKKIRNHFFIQVEFSKLAILINLKQKQ
jgi:hypothetical protein